jgi:hypothetical protein
MHLPTGAALSARGVFAIRPRCHCASVALIWLVLLPLVDGQWQVI